MHANVLDVDKSEIGGWLRPVLAELSQTLTDDYGGTMEHLWIDVELTEFGSKPDGSPRHPFRFQKRVSGRSHFGLPPRPDMFNVGHFSVRPDFEFLMSLTEKRAVRYALSLIYQGTAVLLAKQRKLGGFDAPRFRERLVTECATLGYRVETQRPATAVLGQSAE
jgi:hypothetical protein